MQAGRKRKSLNFRFVLSEIDKTFFLIVVILLVFGLIMVFSASYAAAESEHGNPYHFVQRQLMCAALGLVAMFVASYLDYNFFFNTKIAYLFFIGSYVLCVITSFFGQETAGARRWFTIFGVQFQPSELLKIAFIVIFGYILSVNFQKFKNSWHHSILPFVIIFIMVFGVLILQRHMSAVMLFGIIGVSMMFVSDIPPKYFWRFIGVCAVAAIIGVLVLVIAGGGNFSYITDRIESWKDPMSDPSNTTHQTYESMLAIGSGGWFGLGFGESRQKYLYLPESQNDFIFAIVGEELGFFRSVLIILLFAALVFRGFVIASRAKSMFERLLVLGISLQVGLQTILNILVVTDLMPNTGISLPFFSYGGTALVMQLVEMGIVLAVSRSGDRKKRAKTDA